MTNDQMREAFHQYAEKRGWDTEHCDGMYRSFETQLQWMGWQAAYAAGMERAAGICARVGQSYDNEWNRRLGIDEDAKDVADECAGAIRAEIPKEEV